MIRVGTVVVTVAVLLLGGTATVHAQRDTNRGEYRREALTLDRASRVELPPWVTWVGLLSTATLGAVLVWSLVDTFEAREDVRLTGTEAQRRAFEESRRNTLGLAAGTAGAGLATLLIATLATDWGGDLEASASASANHAYVSLRLRL